MLQSKLPLRPSQSLEAIEALQAFTVGSEVSFTAASASKQNDAIEPIKGIRVILDVSYIDNAIPKAKLIGLISGAVSTRLMVNELKCGGIVFGFTENYLGMRSDLNDSPTIREKAESLRAQLGVRVNAQTDESPGTTL